MNVKLLEHINLRTPDMESLALWYEKILELERGYRPPFGVDGIWLYAGDIPMVHLLKVEKENNGSNPRMEHFAMRAEGLESFIRKLEIEEITYQTLRVPELRILQVYIEDPEGNHMHIDFKPEEADALGLN